MTRDTTATTPISTRTVAAWTIGSVAFGLCFPLLAYLIVGWTFDVDFLLDEIQRLRTFSSGIGIIEPMSMLVAAR